MKYDTIALAVQAVITLQNSPTPASNADIGDLFISILELLYGQALITSIINAEQAPT